MTTTEATTTSAPEGPTPTAPRPGLRWPTARTWADIAVMLVLAMLGVIGFEPSFGGYGFLIAGLGGLVLGAATGILTSVFRVGAVMTVLVAIIAYFLVGTPLAVPEQALYTVLPSLQSLASLAVGTVYGWADIVTLSTPIGAPQYIAVVPYFAAWFVALLSTTLATRWLASRPRAAWRFGIALIAPIALYLASILIGTDEPYQAGIRGVVFAVLALVWLGWRRHGASIAQGGAARLRNRKLAGTAIIVVGAVAIGGVAGFAAAPPNDSRFVLREEIEPPFDPLDYPSPLSGFRHYTKQVTDDVMFTVDGLAVGDVIRLATLDSFTGKLWNVTGPDSSTDGSGEFQLVGRELPEPDVHHRRAARRRDLHDRRLRRRVAAVGRLPGRHRLHRGRRRRAHRRPALQLADRHRRGHERRARRRCVHDGCHGAGGAQPRRPRRHRHRQRRAPTGRGLARHRRGAGRRSSPAHPPLPSTSSRPCAWPSSTPGS